MPGTALAASSTRGVARRAWRGLIQVLAAPDAAPAWWRPPWQRRAYIALGVTTLALGVANLASMHSQPTATPAPSSACRASPCHFLHYPSLSIGQMLLAVAVVTPLLLAARYPLLGWRLGWLALLLAPLVPGGWRGGWPWGPAQLLVLLAVFCVAGVRYRRPALWWMWALSLIPSWIWFARDLADLNGPLGATIVFTAGMIAADSVSSRWRTQRALAAQTERTELEQARRAVLEERTRIARELHDVVAHHMSLIAVRAETAPYRLSDLPEPVRAEFASLSDGAREALADMRRLLGVLRQDQPAGLAPQPIRGAATHRDDMMSGNAAESGPPTRCLIADDQAMVREGFAAVLAAQPGLLVVGQAADGADAVSQARQLAPDVVLMDVRMPVMDGLQATRQILGTAPGPHAPRVLMLTTFDLDDYVYEALRSGASGFLLKDATAAELVHAVRVVAAGDALLAPSVTRRLIADFARRPRPDPPPPAALGALTHRETEVLRLIAGGLSNAEISDTLVIAGQTTKTYVGRILAKLDLRDRAQAVVLAYETGLVTPGGPGPARTNPDTRPHQ